MDFVDEKCDVFDNDEENKFIYTDIHREFMDHMDALISSNLQELDISSDVFYEACASSRNSRDINRAVFEKLIAMEDFNVFKKIMVKRNTELQLEAMASYRDLDRGEVQDEEEAVSAEEELYRTSLLELEMMQKQEELEQIELEKALALSLLVEEERVKQVRQEMKRSGADERETSERKSEEKSSTGSKQIESKHTPSSSTASEFADPKPLKPLKLGGGIGFGAKSALPPIGSALTEKQKLVEETSRKNQQRVSEQMKTRNELSLGVDEEEAERRAKYMREQRDKLLQKKKAERDEKVRQELERTGVSNNTKSVHNSTATKSESKSSNDDEESKYQEQQRDMLRLALARRMKQELYESEEAKAYHLHEEQFSQLDRKLQQVEKLRQENMQREQVLTDHLKRSQAQMARNVQRSAANMRLDG